MHQSDIKIFELIDLLIQLGKIDYTNDFGKSVGVLKQNFSRIKQGKAHFTSEHIRKACEVYKVNANWIFGTESEVFTKIKSNQKSVQLY